MSLRTNFNNCKYQSEAISSDWYFLVTQKTLKVIGKKIAIAFFLSTTISLFSEENLDFSGKKNLISPEINGQNVTFRLLAPNAKSVKLQGNWLPYNGMEAGSVDLQKDKDGVWSFSKNDFNPDIFSGDMETYFKEIMDFTEANYRVKADTKNRAVAGLSMGGFHSLYISANQPKTFDYVGLFSPATHPLEDKRSPIYANIDEKLKVQQKNGYKLYWIAIGKTDFLYKMVTEHRQKLDKMNFKYQYVESEGGHTWSNWRKYLNEFVPQLFK